MHPRLPAALGLLLVAGLATACSDTTAPAPVSANQTASASGSGGGNGGGGGGGGTGGGGGGGGSTVGRITRASGAAVCDAGTSIGITLDKGFNNRVNAQMAWTGIATGPAIPPSTFPQTSLGGWWDVSLTDAATGALVMGFGTGVGATTPSMLITNLGGTVTVGVHTLNFVATKLPVDPITGVRGGTVAETCTASITVVAR